MHSSNRRSQNVVYRACCSIIALALLVGEVLLPTSAKAGETPPSRDAPGLPNILVFVADDAGWRDFGAYGNDAIRTPHVDQLARSGLRIEKAFLTVAQCSPSRISILSGKYPHATGAEDLFMPLPEGETLVSTHLREAGYFTGIMAKRHLGAHGNEQFDWYDPASGKDFSAFSDFLNQAQRMEEPFFIWIGFRDPHRDYQSDILETPHAPSGVVVPSYLADTLPTRRDLAHYYNEIARMDQNIGRMMEMLRRREMRENTLVVFLSDNGAPFPRAKATVYDAGIRTPLIFSWPAKIEARQVYEESLVSVVDLAPTFLELAGAESPPEMQGRSLAGLLEDPASHPGRTYVFAERNWHGCDEHIRAVRTERYKFILNEDYTALPLCTPSDVTGSPSWFSLKRLQERGALTHAQTRLFEAPRASVELYDLQEDPGEFVNKAGQAAYRDAATRLARVLSQWKERTQDFPPTQRRRADAIDRITGVRFMEVEEIPPLQNDTE